MKRLIKKLLAPVLCLLALAAGRVLAAEIPQAIGPFGGLNTSESPEAIGATQAQDLLNVNISPSGKSVKRREGSALDNTFTTSTSPVHGAYSFYDASGNQVRLFGQDKYLWASVAGAPYVAVATGTVNTTWQCTDYLGFAYCVTSARDSPVKTNGTSAGSTYQPGITNGTTIASTPERLLVANTTSNPSRLFYSGASNFTDFTVGTTATSSSFEDITAPGSSITMVRYRYGRWLWWKDQSFGYLIGTDQTNLESKTVSDTIGTFDNSDIFDQGITYFRGNDGLVYTYDGSVLSPLISRDIKPTLQSANRRKSNSWTLTTQSDWQSGTEQPDDNLSFTISSGDIVPSSHTKTDTTTADFSAGTKTDMTVASNRVFLTTNTAGNINSADFEDGSGGTDLGSNWSNPGASPWVRDDTQSVRDCTITPQSGTYFARTSGLTSSPPKLRVILASDSSTLAEQTISCNNPCAWVQKTLSSVSDAGKRVKFRFIGMDGASDLTTVQSYIFGGSVTYHARCDCSDGSCSASVGAIDNVVGGSSTINTGSFTSQTFDLQASSNVVTFAASWTLNDLTPTISLQTSASGSGLWATVTGSTGTAVVRTNRYVRYTSTFTVGPGDDALTTLDDVTIVAKSTGGTYYSPVNNATALTAWSALYITDSTDGSSSLTYYVRASTAQFTVLSSTPNWATQTKNATVNYSTGTYFQLRAGFVVTSPTDTPKLSESIFNWFEGNAADKMYSTYHDYALWFAVSLGTTTSVNNRVARFDLLSNLWTLYDIGSNGFLAYNNSLYFGDPSAGKSYKFGGVNADNNAAINSYWRSKAFFGDSPFNEKELRTSSFFVKASSGTTLSVTYTRDRVATSTSTYTINLYDGNASFIRNNRRLPAGQRATLFDVQFGDNSTNPSWEVFGGQMTYEPIPWRVYP